MRSRRTEEVASAPAPEKLEEVVENFERFVLLLARELGPPDRPSNLLETEA